MKTLIKQQIKEERSVLCTCYLDEHSVNKALQMVRNPGMFSAIAALPLVARKASNTMGAFMEQLLQRRPCPSSAPGAQLLAGNFALLGRESWRSTQRWARARAPRTRRGRHCVLEPPR
jgi:hypothetical protein